MIDPKLRHCICGHTWYFNKWDYVKMILFDKIIVRCPQCHRKHEYKLYYFADEIHKTTREENKKLIEKLKGVWQNG